jgi:hypothetical protein
MKSVFPYLIYAGAIPFILCALLLGTDIQEIPELGSVKSILSVYGLVIASFLTGSHWGQCLQLQANQQGIFFLVLSNLIALFICLSFLILSFKALMAALIASFILLLAIDYRIFQLQLITAHYFQIRCLVSAAVIISLIISGVVS